MALRDEFRRTVGLPDDQELVIIITHEGVIFDLVDLSGVVLGTECATFDEIAERVS